MKILLIHLVARHQDVIEEVFHIAHVHPLVVAAVLAGVSVEQEVFDRVLSALNQLAGTTYTQDDFSDVSILDIKEKTDAGVVQATKVDSYSPWMGCANGDETHLRP